MVKKVILAATVAGLALTASACNRAPAYGYYNDGYYAGANTQVCTDRAGRRVPDINCQQAYYGGGYNPYLWYYVGGGYPVPYYGTVVHGGTWSRPSNFRSYVRAPAQANVTRSVAVSRGGLGSTSRSFAQTYSSPSRSYSSSSYSSPSRSYSSSSYSSSRSSFSGGGRSFGGSVSS
jgi:uncharacterized membrane protein YgcG